MIIANSNLFLTKHHKIPQRGLVAYYDMSNIKNNILYDSYSNYDVKLVNAVNLVDSGFNAISFFSNGYGTISNGNAIIAQRSEFSVSVQYKLPATNSRPLMGDFVHYPDSESFYLVVNSVVAYHLIYTSGAAYNGSGSLGLVNTWGHVVFTWKSGDAIRIWHNGVLVITTGVGVGTIKTYTQPFYIGRDGYSSPSYINGYLADIAFYDRQLEVHEIMSLYGKSRGLV